MNEGSKVKGIYYGENYTGVITKIRCYYGDDRELMNHLMYYVKLDVPFTTGLKEKKILIHGSKCSIQLQ